MKISVVPAQITTIEDKIIGNLTFNQILLLIVPLVLGTIIYLLLPPSSQLTLAKLVLITLLCLVFGLLAVRFRGRTGAGWLIIFLSYNLRPHFYLFTKNDSSTRALVFVNKTKEITKEKETSTKETVVATFSQANQLLLNQLLTDPSLSVRLELDKKGEIDVSLSKSKR